ncbi:MAG: EutN/CcmL family microcompartment protein [Ignavibacteria bacterium]|jgi:microcompartment protein CcmK/EutM
MKIGKVIGNVVSTKKVGNTQSLKIMVVRYLNEIMEETNSIAACIDTVSAGEGDIVLLCSSSSARLTEKTNKACIDNAIVGIIDSISVGNNYIYQKTNKDGE